nr:Os02g0709701 [Ipomoea trifida]
MAVWIHHVESFRVFGPHNSFKLSPHIHQLAAVRFDAVGIFRRQDAGAHRNRADGIQNLPLVRPAFPSHGEPALPAVTVGSPNRPLVCIASSTRKAGPVLGSSWNAKSTWPRRWPKRVPTTRVPKPDEASPVLLLPPKVRADRILETAVLRCGLGGRGTAKSSSGSLRSGNSEWKVRISSRSSSSPSSIFFLQLKYLLEKEKESFGFLAMIVFILENEGKSSVVEEDGR